MSTLGIPWAARCYNWLLIEVTLKGVVVSFPFFSKGMSTDVERHLIEVTLKGVVFSFPFFSKGMGGEVERHLSRRKEAVH